MRVRIGAILLGVALLAGCGGGGGGGSTTPGGASVVPGDAAGFLSVSSDTSSDSWHKAMSLLDRFPGKDSILGRFRTELANQGLSWDRDVEPALGDEFDFVWLDFRKGADDVVGLTQPKDEQKLNQLLERGGNPAVHETVDGWTVFADTNAQLDEFNSRSKQGGSLDDQSTFDDAMSDLPADAIAKAFVSGAALQTQIHNEAQRQGAPGSVVGGIGSIDSIGAALTPEADGIRVRANVSGTNVGGSAFHAELPTMLPSGALAYLSYHDIGASIRKAADAAAAQNPSFDRQRAQIESLLGFSLDDLANLLSGEQAVAVYRSARGAPAIVFAARVQDESKARLLVQRLGSLATFGGGLTVHPVQVGSIHATRFTQNDVSIFIAVFNGNLVATNGRPALAALATRAGTLSDDETYKAAVSAAGKPNETNGFVYLNLQDGLRYVVRLATGRGARIPLEVRQNIVPLQSLLLYSTRSGNQLRINGFLGIR